MYRTLKVRILKARPKAPRAGVQNHFLRQVPLRERETKEGPEEGRLKIQVRAQGAQDVVQSRPTRLRGAQESVTETTPAASLLG